MWWWYLWFCGSDGNVGNDNIICGKGCYGTDCAVLNDGIGGCKGGCGGG